MKTPIAIAAALTLAFAGCKSTENEMHSLADSWRKPGVSGPYKTLLVMGLTENHTQRVALETAVAKDLEERGHKALLGYKASKNPEMFVEQDFKAFCKNYSVDAVVTITTQDDVVAVQRTEVAILANANFTEVIEASVTTTDVDEDFIVDVVIWDAKAWTPIWAGRSETMDDFVIGPGGVDEFVTTSVTVGAGL